MSKKYDINLTGIGKITMKRDVQPSLISRQSVVWEESLAS
jgi:hypothetical protein